MLIHTVAFGVSISTTMLGLGLGLGLGLVLVLVLVLAQVRVRRVSDCFPVRPTWAVAVAVVGGGSTSRRSTERRLLLLLLRRPRRRHHHHHPLLLYPLCRRCCSCRCSCRWERPVMQGDTTGVNATWGDLEGAVLIREKDFLAAIEWYMSTTV